MLEDSNHQRDNASYHATSFYGEAIVHSILRIRSMGCGYMLQTKKFWIDINCTVAICSILTLDG